MAVAVAVADAGDSLVPIREASSCADQLAAFAECRICQEEDQTSNLESPCACSGTLKYAHHKCVQRWCNEKGDTVCEICHEPYKYGYHSPLHRPLPLQLPPGAVAIDFSDEWGVLGSNTIELRDPRILALAAAQRHFLESEYNEYSTIHSSSVTTSFRLLALILLAFLLLRHVISMMDSTADDDASIFVLIFLLRVVGFFLPCYLVVRAMNMLEAHRQELQETATTTQELGLLVHTRNP